MNDINSIAGIDDFADEMKKNVEALRDLQAKYERCLKLIKNIQQYYDHDMFFSLNYEAKKLLKELNDND